jgi:hypothetical protein
MHVLHFKDSGLRRRTPVRPVLLTGQTGLVLLQLRLRFSGLGFVDQPRNPVRLRVGPYRARIREQHDRGTEGAVRLAVACSRHYIT